MAEVMKFEDFKNEGSESAVKVQKLIFVIFKVKRKFKQQWKIINNL